MAEVLDQIDDQGRVVMTVDYERDGVYVLIRGNEENYEAVKRSESVVELVGYITDNFEGDPQVIMSDIAEMSWALEVSNGSEWELEIVLGDEKD